MPMAMGGEAKGTGLGVLMTKLHLQMLCREYGERFIGPLDDAHSFALNVLLQTQVKGFSWVVYPVKVDVVEHEAASILRRQDEGRAPDVCLDAQPLRDALGEAGLAGAQLTHQEDEVAGLRRLAQPSPQCLGLLWCMGYGS